MHVLKSALIALLLFAGMCSTALPAVANQSHVRHPRHPAAKTVTSPAADRAQHHHKHKAAAAAPNPKAVKHAGKHAGKHEALVATLRKQNELLYQLRHERNAYAQRIAHLKKLVHPKSGSKSGHAARLAKLKEQQAHESNSAALSHKKQSKHPTAQDRKTKIAARHAKQVVQSAASKRAAAKQAAVLHAHNVRLAAMKAHTAKLESEHLQRLAQIEAQRRKNAERPSKAVPIATSSGLPIWRGEAYAAEVPVKVVTVDLNDPAIHVSALIARNGIGSSEPFTQMIRRTHPYVAVTGTFFSLDNLRPVGDIVINGSLAYFGGMGTALAIKPNNHADMITVPWGRHHDWTGYDTVVACGPRLLKDGQVVLDPHQEHFKDQHMLAPNSRIAVGIADHNQLVFCMTRDPIYLGRLAKIMKSLGCRQAMNLDAGTSTGFYCNGDLMAQPGRRLTNAIVVYTDGKGRHDMASRPDRIGTPKTQPTSHQVADLARLAVHAGPAQLASRVIGR